jgi:hypothetical protein
MVNLGKNVILRPPTGAERVSDLLVDNVPYDVYTPTTTNADRIIWVWLKLFDLKSLGEIEPGFI